MTSAIFPDLNGACVFLTGGASGIGAALTEGFVRQGARLTVIDLLDGTALADRLEAAHGNRPLFIRGDITDTAVLTAAMDRAVAEHGPLKVLVNDAANDQRFPVAEVTEADWDAMQAINLKSYFFACQKAAALMETGGVIVNFSSTSYMIGSELLSPYVAANAGIMGLTRSLARELGPRGIRVNALAPGWVMTEKQKRLWVTEEGVRAFMERQCLKEMMQPEDVVGGALFLASDASRMITGQTLVIDAGVVVTG
ncbi:MAG: SDR family oxidoreductase [Limimaricola sp.]|uniref:SDR family NAD(P)-dependent oxidoreductase n=1 Tax=Limimaricola sp. TaxID=2211665 RepID=UPI001D9BE3FA|nr:SDR family oxidoreductase [Limimaricola sp.]MBI1417539.1 SDR family oxidoreductase [Limimaricola sp.]